MKNAPLQSALNSYNEFLGHLREAHTVAVLGNSALAELAVFDLLDPAHAFGRRLESVATAMRGEPPVKE